MTISTVAPDWLALRAGADDRARSAVLAARLSHLIPPGRVVVHDLGAGTGAMTRWLAPRLPGPQRWVLHDADAGILSRLDVGSAADDEGRRVVADVRVEELAALAPDAFRQAAAVTASALLDVVTADEAARIVAACVAARAPALFSLSVTGKVRLAPGTADQAGAAAVLGAAFDDHQRRDAEGRRMLGPGAVAVVSAAFAAAGWTVRRAATPWRLGPGDEQLIVAWLDGWIGAAVELQPGLAALAHEHRERWHAQALAGRLRVTVSHEDVLAWPD